jgi:hypothetical protein
LNEFPVGTSVTRTPDEEKPSASCPAETKDGPRFNPASTHNPSTIFILDSMQGPPDPTSKNLSCKAASSAFGSKSEGKSNYARVYYESTQVNQIKNFEDKKQVQRLYSENIEQKTNCRGPQQLARSTVRRFNRVLFDTYLPTTYNCQHEIQY